MMFADNNSISDDAVDRAHWLQPPAEQQDGTLVAEPHASLVVAVPVASVDFETVPLDWSTWNSDHMRYC